MIITISGTPGSGKSSVGKIVAGRLGYERLYMGALYRKMAREMGITVEEENLLAEKDPSFDRKIDDEIRKAVEGKDDLVIESRTAAGLFRKWGMRKDTLHVLLKCDLREAARRVFRQKSEEDGGGRNERPTESEEEQLEDLKERKRSETRRYMKYYGFDCYDEGLYDLVLDTTKMSIKETAEKILERAG